MRVFAGFLALVCTTALVIAEGVQEGILGSWSHDDTVLNFYDAGIGREVDGATERYFRYSFPSADQLALDYSAGETSQYTVALTNETLEITDDQEVTTVFAAVEDTTHPCVKNLHQLRGARVLFALDHPDEENPRLQDLFPEYLSSFPVCPDGGIYSTEAPICSIAEHRLP